MGCKGSTVGWKGVLGSAVFPVALQPPHFLSRLLPKLRLPLLTVPLSPAF